MTTKALYNSVRTIRLYGQFGVRFGRVHRLAVSSVAEAIKALCVLHAGFEAYLMNAKDNGMGFAVFIGKRNISEDRLHWIANDDIRIAPILTGSKNSGIFSIILGVALIAVSFFIPGGPLIAAALFNAGVAMALGGVVQLLSPQPKDAQSKEKKENEPNYAFNGPVNTQAQGGCVPVAYGRPWTGSHVISAGISLDDIYAPIVDTSVASLAAEFLASLKEMWPLDSNLNGIKYGVASALTPDTASPIYSAGRLDGQAFFQSAVRSNVPGTFSPMQSYTFGFIFDIQGGGTGVNTGFNTFVGLLPSGFGYATFRALIGSYLDGTVIQAFSNVVSPTEFVTTPASAGRVSVVLNVHQSTDEFGANVHNVELFVEGVSVGTAGPVNGFNDASQLAITNSGASVVCIDGIDNVFVSQPVLSAEVIAYYGTGKRYADIVADSVDGGLSSGQGKEGGDGYNMMVEAVT